MQSKGWNDKTNMPSFPSIYTETMSKTTEKEMWEAGRDGKCISSSDCDSKTRLHKGIKAGFFIDGGGEGVY